jgi:hypothetical protein
MSRGASRKIGSAATVGYTDLIWVALPIWQVEFGLSYAAVGALRMIYTGTMAGLQIPAAHIAERLGGGAVLALGTTLCGLCYCLAGFGYGFWWLMAVLFLGGLGAAPQHPIGSALVTRTFTGARALSAFGTYNSPQHMPGTSHAQGPPLRLSAVRLARRLLGIKRCTNCHARSRRPMGVFVRSERAQALTSRQILRHHRYPDCEAMRERQAE